MDYYSMHPWSKLDIIREVFVFTFVKRIQKLSHAQSLSRTSSEKDVIVIPCRPEELVCKDCVNETSFCFLYETLFTKLGIRFPLNPFQKRNSSNYERSPCPVASKQLGLCSSLLHSVWATGPCSELQHVFILFL